MVKFTSITVLSLAALTAAEPGRTRRSTTVFPADMGVREILLKFRQFSDDISTHAYNIERHGCWCSKMNSQYGTGGDAIDEFDAVCKEWMKARRCLDLEDGACEAGLNFGGYQAGGDSMDISAEEWCEDADYDDCQNSMCVVDYTYVKKMIDVINTNGFDVNRNAVCTPSVGDNSEKICQGDAPDLKIVPKATADCGGINVNNLDADFPTIEQNCGWLISEEMLEATYNAGTPWPFDATVLQEGHGAIDMGSYLSASIRSVPEVTNFYQQTSAFIQRDGCELTLYSGEYCGNESYNFNNCIADGRSFSQVRNGYGYDFCENVGRMNNRAVYYTCTCPGLRSLGTNDDVDPLSA